MEAEEGYGLDAAAGTGAHTVADMAMGSQGGVGGLGGLGWEWFRLREAP